MSSTSTATSELSMIIKLPLYTLKYDEKTEGLRDKTYSELIKEHGHGKIKCSCMNRVYELSSQFVKSHFDTQKHKTWVAESQKDYIKHFGHCCSQQDIINLLNKELRELKCNITHLTNKNKSLAHENIKLDVVNRSLHEEIKVLKDQISRCESEDEGEG
jgi:FtsZ-binding cell division protein ZapB